METSSSECLSSVTSRRPRVRWFAERPVPLESVTTPVPVPPHGFQPPLLRPLQFGCPWPGLANKTGHSDRPVRTPLHPGPRLCPRTSPGQAACWEGSPPPARPRPPGLGCDSVAALHRPARLSRPRLRGREGAPAGTAPADPQRPQCEMVVVCSRHSPGRLSRGDGKLCRVLCP